MFRQEDQLEIQTLTLKLSKEKELSTLDNDTSFKYKITCNNAKYEKSYHETLLISTGSGSRLTYKRDGRMSEREILSSIKYVHTNEINENMNIV